MTVQLKSLTDITPHSRHIFLSPHFDDAIYSCGGTLGVQVNCGLHPLVITVFAGTPPPGTELSPFATLIHRRMGSARTQEWRPSWLPGVKKMLAHSTTSTLITSGWIILMPSTVAYQHTIQEIVT